MRRIILDAGTPRRRAHLSVTSNFGAIRLLERFAHQPHRSPGVQLARTISVEDLARRGQQQPEVHHWPPIRDQPFRPYSAVAPVEGEPLRGPVSRDHQSELPASSGWFRVLSSPPRSRGVPPSTSQDGSVKLS